MDAESGAGLLVQARGGRAVLMHQDILHRLTPPSELPRRPRYSLVWKLIFWPRRPAEGRPESIVRDEWREPGARGGEHVRVSSG